MHLFAFFFFPIFGSGIILYFLPSIIAFARSKRDATSIFVLNFLLGWTLIGWVIALVWALKHDVPVMAR
jgi:Superinfection immunity protein